MLFTNVNFKGFLIHLLLMVLLVAAIFIGFFNFYLPNSTDHGETVTVPDLNGMKLSEIESFLGSRDLRFAISDSSFSSDFPPLTVLSQNPVPGAKVKENRRIYLSINSMVPPTIEMPNLIDMSMKSAQMNLQSYGLVMGKVEYVPDLAQNAVLKQFHNGREIKSGQELPKGSVIDLTVGDGLGQNSFSVPDLTGMAIDEVEVLLIGQGLQVGSKIFVEDSSLPRGQVVKQRPSADGDRKVRVGEQIDLWVAGKNPEKSQEIESSENFDEPY